MYFLCLMCIVNKHLGLRHFMALSTSFYYNWPRFLTNNLLLFFKMLSLEQIIYLIQCGTGFRHIITKLNEKFPNTYGCSEA
jgi:hypothetical protein